MTEISGGELLLRSLHTEGVRYINAITDGTYMIFLEALERLGEELDMHLVVPRHEAAGAHFADALTRISGEPAVAMACAGPGAANLLSGIICAQAEGSPVVAITTRRRSDVSDNYRHMGGTQSPNHLELFRPAVKWNGSIDHWQRIPDMVRHAFRVATSGSPGPVHLLIAEDVLNQEGDLASVTLWPPERTRVIDNGMADPYEVKQAAKMLVEAGMVNIHAGNGANRSGAGLEILALAEHLKSPVTNNASARGVVPEDHELAFPPLCMASYMAHVQADLILGVGTRFGELAMWGRPPLWGDPAEQPTIQIDSNPTNIGLNRPVDIALIGDARVVMGQLLSAVKELTPPKDADPRVAELQMFREQWWRGLEKDIEDMDRAPILTGQILKVCREFFADDAIVTLDGGNTVMWAMHYIVPKTPGSVLYTANMGYLGTGLPYAIGAKIAAPERPVYSISGDSAFGFNIQELETAVRLNLPIINIVAVDGAFGMEKSAQKRVFNREAPWFHHDHAPVRYDKVAEAMGCHGEYVDKASDLWDALERSVASGKPAVIHAAVDPEANVDPPGLYLWNMARSGKVG
ncbi:MAG: thiamine pyrophosphate-binding protein [Candidatus Promineifilaceae bacterium]|nr:thiamine pyrophosphate-binding protein [Candidatus Promineifilaceae bacterium]